MRQQGSSVRSGTYSKRSPPSRRHTQAVHCRTPPLATCPPSRMTAASFSVAQTPDAGATNLPTGYIHTFRRSVLFASSHTSPDMVCPSAHTPSFARLRTWAHLRWRAHLRRRRPARTNQTTFKWPRANKLRTDGPAAPTPHSRGLNTWRPQRFVTMSRLSARYAQLIRMCRRRGCSPEDAKDLVQEAHRRWFDYQQTTKVRDVDALLRRILLNLSISHYRELTSPFTFENAERLDRRGLLVDPASPRSGWSQPSRN